jgi:hypothetical protein
VERAAELERPTGARAVTPPAPGGRTALDRLRAAARRPETALFVLAFGSYAYFFQGGGWNANSRFDLVRAVVEQRTLRIDDYADNTRDLAFFGGHVYCEKAPGLSMLAVPVYSAVYPFAHGQRPRGRLIHFAAYLATVLTVSLPSAIAVALLFRIAVRLGAPAAAAAALAASYAFATLAFPYATLFYAHQLVAALMVAAFAVILTGRDRRGGLTARRLALVGLLLGYAIASEYPAALLAAVLGVYAAVVTRPWLRLGWVVAGAAVPLLGLAAYHAAAFGGPFTVPYAGSLDPNRQGGLFLGITPPDPAILMKVLFSIERGLLHHTPWLILAAPGIVGLFRRRATRLEGAVCLAAIAVGLAFNSALTKTPDDWRGGAGVGTRVLIPWLPFFVIAIAGLASPVRSDWLRRPLLRGIVAAAFAGLVTISASRMLLATAIRPEVNKVDDPFADYYLPLWRQDKVAVNTFAFHGGNTDPKYAWNLGERMGLQGRASLLPLASFAFAAGVWLVRTVHFNRMGSLRRSAGPIGSASSGSVHSA